MRYLGSLTSTGSPLTASTTLVDSPPISVEHKVIPEQPATAGDQARRVTWRDVTSDIILGFADGLTVPFALTAGLSSLGSSRLVILGGLAELFSGAISMSLGAWLAAQTEAQRYDAEVDKITTKSSGAAIMHEEVVTLFEGYGVQKDKAQGVIEDLMRDQEMWLKFTTDMVLKLQKPAAAQATFSAIAMGISYFVGGIIPMLPYFCTDKINTALFTSIGITVVILLSFGYVKTRLIVTSTRVAVLGALQTLLVGAAAAGASYGIVRAVDSRGGGA